jgi:methylenetetrahydrofolate dehydrogenase (NADP+)/methenyltetrahydrofolate cyclohydrolase
VKPGAVIVDFGSPVGDVEMQSVAEIASAITPVPGGTGPITVAVIAEQTLRAAELRRDAD